MAIPTIEDIRELDPGERLELISRLWDSLEDRPAHLTTAQRNELARRLDSFDEESAAAVSWDHLSAELAAHAP